MLKSRFLLGVFVLIGCSPALFAGPPEPPPPPVTLQGTGVGPIPDDATDNGGMGTPLEIRFEVEGYEVRTPDTVDAFINIAISHTWAGDLTAILKAPNGGPEHTIFGRIGVNSSSTLGRSDDFNGQFYTFGLSIGDPNIWDTPGDPIPSGSYRTVESGNASSASPPPVTNPADTFSSVTNPNGTWILEVRDDISFDTGSVSSAFLTLINIVESEELCIPVQAENGGFSTVCL